MQTIDLFARDITGVAKQQRRRQLVKVAIAVFLITAALIWFTV